MRGIIWRVIALAVIFSTAVACLPGCKVSPAAHSGDVKVNPFFADRVAAVRILLPEQDWQALMARAFNKDYFKADFWFDGELVPGVGLRTKGNASLLETVNWKSQRFPLAIDFNLFNRARTFHGLKKVHFNNGWGDPTLIRDVICYDIFREMGLPTPRASLVDLYVNDHHLGVYTMSEAVDTSLLECYFTNFSGNLYKPEVAAARLDWTEKNAYQKLTLYGMPITRPEENPVLEQNWGGGRLGDILRALDMEDEFTVSASVNETEGIAMGSMLMPRNYLEAAGLKTNQDVADYSGLYKLLDVLNKVPDDAFPREIEKVLDVDEALKFLAISTGLVHLDNYIGIGHNTYLYDDNGKFTLIPWDLNMTFGTFSSGVRNDGIINWFIDEPTSGPMKRFPLVKRLFAYPPYLDTYHRYLRQLLDGPFNPDTLLPKIDRLYDMIRPYAKADTEMFYAYEDWERCKTEDLRPPDAFPGWMAGGQSPAMPFMLPPAQGAAIYKKFKVRSLYELTNYNFQPEELEFLKKTLSDKDYHLFLQNRYGPLEAPQPPRQPGFGPNSQGLKTVILARWESVRQQLAGERPASNGDGTGNRASMWLADVFSPPR